MTYMFQRSLIAGVSTLGLMAGVAQADQQILDDLIVDGSICVGQDCVNGESFGFDTIRLKENNLRIRAMDTSNSGSFPTRDWQLVFNDSSNGGQDRFSVEDIDGGRTPFTIEANAPSHSLYTDDGGRIGLGTSTPVVELHVVDGDSPTLRLEQDGSSGFTPQTWDVAGNETNFFVRDATNGSRIPFKIRPTAPTGSLDIQADGDVLMASGSLGLGNFSGVAREDGLHISGDGSARRFILLTQSTAGTTWTMSNYETGAVEGGGNFGINGFGLGSVFKIDQTGAIYFPKLGACASGIKTDASGKLSCI
jgi:hypothetical protein